MGSYHRLMLLRMLRTQGRTAALSLVLVLPSSSTPARSEGAGKNFLADAVAKASPSVVNVVSMVRGSVLVAASAGSGFIIDNGFVVTNAHVVERGSGAVRVTTWDGTKLTGRVHSMDRRADIALVKLDSAGFQRSLPTARLGNSSEVIPGEFVAALGSPLTLSNSVTFGIVSSVSRNGSELGMGRGSIDYIQTDAAINVGNSGGPLINMEGEVIGINTMKLRGSDGISFAIPIDQAKIVIQHLQRGLKVSRPYLGLRISTADKLGSTADTSKVIVSMVDPNSPADIAGIEM